MLSTGARTQAKSCALSANKNPVGCAHGVFDKPGDTYFRECSHYHRPEVLNYCVRNGNRCFHQAVWSPKKYVALVSTTHLNLVLNARAVEIAELQIPLKSQCVKHCASKNPSPQFTFVLEIIKRGTPLHKIYKSVE